MRPSTRAGGRLRVVVLGPSLHQWLGGQEVQADQLVREWLDDPDVDLTFVPVNPKLPRPLAWIERLRYIRTIARIPTRLLAMWWGMRRAHVVHVFSASHSSFVIATLPAWCAAKVLRKPVLIHYHSPRGQDHVRSSALARTILRRSDAVVVPSEYLRDIFGGEAIATHVIPNVVDFSLFKFRGRVPTDPILLCCRNFERYCGVDLVLRAFAEVKSERPSARLLLVGRGPEERGLRELADKLGLKGVEFCGPVPRDRIGEVFERADILVNASRLDNMPVSILEAYAAGLPVVTTAAGGIFRMVEHERTGLLCAPEDVSALAHSIIRVMKDRSLAGQLAGRAKREVARCEWRVTRPLWLAVYDSLVEPVIEVAARPN